MGTPTGGSGMGSIHKQDLKMEKFLGDIGNIKTTHGENTSNVITIAPAKNTLDKNDQPLGPANPFGKALTEGAANIMSSATTSATTGKVIADAVNKMNEERMSNVLSGTKYKSGELEKTASSYTEPKNPADK